jgi:hypothetical protein
MDVPRSSAITATITAFLGAGLTCIAASLALGNLGVLVAFFLAVVTKHLDHLGKMAGML